MTDTSVRICFVCGQSGLMAPRGNPRRFNCAYAAMDAQMQPSGVCWAKRFPTCGSELLRIFPPTEAATLRQRLSRERSLQAVAQIGELFEAGSLTLATGKELLTEYGTRRLRSFAQRLGTETPLGESLSSIVRELTQPVSIKHPQDHLPGETRAALVSALPPDFSRAVEMWREVSLNIEKLKQERGVRNSTYTAKRLIRDAELLCVFLAQIGLQHWEEMAPRHYLLFRLEHGLSIACSVFQFLKFVKSRFPRMTARFFRPTQPKTVITERLTDRDRIIKAIQAAEDADDAAIALLLCFIGLYAQTLVACTKLAVGDFRIRNEKVEAKFHEVWIPLDTVTATLLKRHLLRSGCGRDALGDPGQAGVCIFQVGSWKLSEQLKARIDVPIPKLRLTAVANVIAQGFIDRNGIHRAFGVSFPTIADVERIFGWQLQGEISDDARQHRRKLLNGQLAKA